MPDPGPAHKSPGTAPGSVDTVDSKGASDEAAQKLTETMN
jgi:hypothetical protein